MTASRVQQAESSRAGLLASLSEARVGVAFALFCLSLATFITLGPWRAVHSSNAYDFASVYGAARVWMNGQNPYDMRLVTEQVRGGGNDPRKFANAESIQPSVYLPTMLPLAATVAWLPWEPAKLIWSCLSAVMFAVSAVMIVAATDLSGPASWLLAAGIFCFSPTFLGLSHGNPSVLACSLATAAVCLVLNQREGWAALALGLAHCLKPQISIAALVLFSLWGYWRSLLLSLVLPVVATLVSILRAPSLSEYWRWLMSLRQALAAASLPGSINDPSPANHWAYSIVNVQALLGVWVHNPALLNAMAWMMAAALAACYLAFRRNAGGDKRFQDMTFFAALTLTIVYHRFYDEQLLLLAIPFLMTYRNQSKAILLPLSMAMLALLLPLHAASEHVPSAVTPATPMGLLLLRPQPIIILGICLLVIPWKAGRARAEKTALGDQERPSSMAASG